MKTQPQIQQPDQNNQEDIPLNTINLNTEHYNGQNVIQMPLQNQNNNLNIDFQQFGKQLQSPQNDYYTYPSNLEMAELHRQCHYILPDEDFLQRCNAESCSCCQKPLRRKRFNALFEDMYTQLADEFGITIPLYFTFIKFVIIVQILILGLYGIFFMNEVKIICNDPPIQICPNKGDCEECQFSGFYSYLAIDHFLWYMSTYREEGYRYYQFATFFVFIINLSLPFCFEILIRYRQYQYWDKEPINHLHENRKSIYVKHLPYKMTQQEIQQFVKLSVSQDQDIRISSKAKLFEAENIIEEVIYIYDFTDITLKNEERECGYLNFLITLRQIEELKEQGKISTLTEIQIKNKQNIQIEELYSLLSKQYVQLKIINSGVNQIMKEGIMFTNRVLVKFNTQELSQITQLHYQKSWYKDILIRYQVLREQQRYNKIRQQELNNKNVNQQQQQQQLKSENSPLKYHLQNNSILNQLQEDFSNKFEEKNHFQVRTESGFRAHEIFWNNLGMNAVQLLKYRVQTVLMTILTIVFLMGGFEVIYVYQQNQKEKKNQGIQLSTAEKAITVIFTIVVSLLSIKSTLTIMRNQQQSRRSTYTDMEETIMKFFVFLHFCLINIFPYLLKLEVWYARERAIAIYDLISLYQNRLIIKIVFHTLHIRHTKFWFQKRSVLKNFNPYLQFQGQLNIKMTPTFYPIRSRNYLMLFNLTVSVIMIYVCPIIVILCIISNTYIYFYDKYAITHHYQIDRKFNINHLSFQIRSYQFILLPFNIYLFIRLFYSFGWLTVVGAPISGFTIIIFIFLRKRIANYIVNNLLNEKKKKESNIYHEQPFIKSYQKYVKKLNIENLSSLLFNVFSINLKKQ